MGDDLKINSDAREVYFKDELIDLRNKEFDLLEYFFRNTGRVLSRGELLECVWDCNIFCNTNTVDVHVSNLRKRLRRLNLATLIKTVHCHGYLMRA